MTVGRSKSGASELPRVITPELRRTLQERYAKAQSLMGQGGRVFRQIHDLLAANLAIDPGNLRYVELLLLNLRQRTAAGIEAGLFERLFRHTPLGAGASLRRAVERQDWSAAAGLAPAALWELGLDPVSLGLAAEVSRGLQHGPTELRYRLAAVELRPQSTETIRDMARSLERLGQFGDARDWWRRLVELEPDDEEAVAALGETAPSVDDREAELERQIESNPADVNSLLHLAHARMASADFDGAQSLLTQASAVGGGDLRIREGWESLSLAQSQRGIDLALAAAQREPSETARRLVERLREEHDRLELGIAHSRAERFPQDGNWKLDLARKLKQGGNYSGAVLRLEELRSHAGFVRVALLELGECWQHLRQFHKALDHYRQAIELSETDSGEAAAGLDDREVKTLALYRGAVLAEALGEPAVARTWLEDVQTRSPAFKDVGERLDKLGPICDKNGFPSG